MFFPFRVIIAGCLAVEMPMKIHRFLFLLFFLTSASIVRPQVQPSIGHPIRKIPFAKEKNSELFVNGRTVIGAIEYSGLDVDNEDYGVFIDDAVYETDFIANLRENRTNIQVDEPFSSDKVEKVLKMLKEWLARRGYPNADVAAYGTKLPRNRMRLRFSVERGPLVRVMEINFVGNKSISNDEFVEDLKKCSGDSWERYDQRRYEYYTQKCSRALMYGKGFFRARIRGITSQLFTKDQRVTVEVDEGIRYRWGQIKIEGETVFTEKEILEMFGQKSGDVADGKSLQDFVYEGLKRGYSEKGYIQFNAEFDPEFVEPEANGFDGVVSALIIIDEGKKFIVRRIEFTGISSDEEKSLRKDLELKEGEIFVPSKLESYIDKINKTGQFYFVDKDQHVEILTNEEAGNLDLVISLKKFQL